MTTPLLKWTGHPLADVGIATLCALVDKTDPEQLTLEDLDVAGSELAAAYREPIMLSYLSCIYPNGPYTNPTMGEETRKNAYLRALSPHRGNADDGTAGLKCLFSGEPATHMLERSHMPMLTGAGVLNFFPMGRSELPVAAPYLLAIQALALGGRRSEGKLLIVHCDDPRWTLQFARRYVARNRILLNLAKTGQLPDRDGPNNVLDRECAGWDNTKKRPKYPDAKAPESLVMADLVEVATERGSGRMADAITSVTVYLISNSGQGPSLAIEHIPGTFVTFLHELHQSTFASHWQRLVARSWRAAKGEAAETTDEAPADGKKKVKAAKPKASSVAPGPGRSRNELYNDLLAIFESGVCNWQAAIRFIRRHLLSNPARLYMDPQRISAAIPKIDGADLELIDWQLTSLFLEKVLGMNKDRIGRIREFADRLAEIIDRHNDKGLFRNLVFTANETQYRLLLTKVQRNYAREKNALLFSFEDYLNMFLADDSSERFYWSLVRDLISIRLVEQLFLKKFFERSINAGALDQAEESNESRETVAV